MKRLILLCFLPAMALAQVVPDCDPATDSSVATATGERIKGDLLNKKFAAVENELLDKLKRYERGEYSDLTLYRELTSAADADPALEPMLAQWVTEKPKSFFAHLLKAKHHSSVGFKKRGEDYVNKTSAEQFAAMKAEFAKSMPEYKLAMDLRPNSSLTYAGLISVAGADVGSEAVRGLLAKSITVDPKNMAARYQAIWFLSPKWGGSVEDLDDILKQTQRSQLDDKKVRFLQFSTEISRAEHYGRVTKEKAKAIMTLRKATQLCPGADPWRKMSELAFEFEDWKTVREAASHVIAVNPNAPRNLVRRGWANEKLGQMGDALKDYEAAVELGNTWAQNHLGHYLMLGQHVPKDWPRARRLLQAAAAKGDANARNNLDWLNKQTGNK